MRYVASWIGCCFTTRFNDIVQSRFSLFCKALKNETLSKKELLLKQSRKLIISNHIFKN